VQCAALRCGDASGRQDVRDRDVRGTHVESKLETRKASFAWAPEEARLYGRQTEYAIALYGATRCDIAEQSIAQHNIA
jgi:hypothetical protein